MRDLTLFVPRLEILNIFFNKQPPALGPTNYVTGPEKQLTFIEHLTCPKHLNELKLYRNLINSGVPSLGYQIFNNPFQLILLRLSIKKTKMQKMK